ncbi:hypothetical protein DPMN_092929 [Dreissena polymorpha]|uniref:Uncharacterized protein n=1 Tax=Dreissena polymorpha TaxID=45954 RepID=A0A9D4R1F7_DREPO|nr:hypothetical protein DPMN_092929 [Dreissena polymorpha]
MLGVTVNKQQLIYLICKALCTDKEFHHLCTQTHKLIVKGDHGTPTAIYNGVIINGADLKTTHEEADVIMIRKMVDAVEAEHTGISVVADDTEVFVLLFPYYVVIKLSLLVIMVSPVKEKAVIDIRKTASKHINIATDLLSAHAISGCDTVPGYFGIGKGTVIKMLITCQSSILLGDMTDCMKKL